MSTQTPTANHLAVDDSAFATIAGRTVPVTVADREWVSEYDVSKFMFTVVTASGARWRVPETNIR